MNRTSRHLRVKSPGFSLVEVMVALAILSISLAGLFAVSSWISEASRHNAQHTEALNAASGKLEELRLTPYPDLVSGNDSLGAMQRTWTVDDHGDTKTVTVTVAWAGLRGQNRDIQLRTLVAP